MDPWLSGLGAGLQGIGQGAMQILMREQDRKEREDERKRLEQEKKDALERANRTYDQQIQQFAFQNQLTPIDQLEQPVAGMEKTSRDLQSMGSMASMLPAQFAAAGRGMSSYGDALSQLAARSRSGLDEKMRKGRTIELADSSGKARKYLQPYELTAQGKRADEVARNAKALRAAGFDEAEADQLANAEPEMFKALLERIRPKTTPQRVVGPDGTVSFVTPPANMEPGSTYTVPGVKANVTVPGQQPYNWSVQTDDTTGEMMLVDPRTGQSRPVRTPAGGPMRNVPEAAKKGQIALDNLQSALDNAEAVVTQTGVTVMPGLAKRNLDAAFADLQLKYKDAAGLGALAGPDMGILNRALGDPTSISALFSGGTEGVLAALKQAKKALSNSKTSFAKTYGMPAPTEPAGALSGLGNLSDTERRIVEQAKSHGYSDEEIAAHIQQLRRGGSE